MNRTAKRFPLTDLHDFKTRLLEWASTASHFAWLDSNQHEDAIGRFQGLLGIGVQSELQGPAKGAFLELGRYRSRTGDWILGYLGYDLKNDIEKLESKNPDRLGFPDYYFFQPQKLIEVQEDHVIFHYPPDISGETDLDYMAIRRTALPGPPEAGGPVGVHMGIFKDAYYRQVDRMLAHIQRGDLYEANFCQEFHAVDPDLNPQDRFRRLNAISRPPFAALFRFGNRYILSASPERYLCKRGKELWSQPMKGTARRDPDPDRDRILGQVLQQDPKERAENIMITDLVRNDLSKHAEKGSVTVEGLCELRSYKQVHQLISTIHARIPKELDPLELIRDSFPMGSMTGAPKVSAMHLIEELESFKRGVYSGALGYITPDGDFDLSVVIRSILYDRDSGKLSFPVGGAITAIADPEAEYAECLLKARAMRSVLVGS